MTFVFLKYKSSSDFFNDMRTCTRSEFFAFMNIYDDVIEILRCDRNRHGGGAACSIRNDLSYNIVSVFPSEIESVFFEILSPNSKPITIGTIYRRPNKSNFLEVLNQKVNKIDSISNEIYILGDFNIKLPLNDAYIFSKKNFN